MKHRQQVVLTDAGHGEDALVLGDLIDGVDQIQALDAVQIALVDTVDAQVPRQSTGRRFAPLADLHWHGAGLLDHVAQTEVGLVSAQVVEMAIGNACQALIAGIAKH